MLGLQVVTYNGKRTLRNQWFNSYVWTTKAVEAWALMIKGPWLLGKQGSRPGHNAPPFIISVIVAVRSQWEL